MNVKYRLQYESYRGGRDGWHAGVADCALVRSPDGAEGEERDEGMVVASEGKKRRARNKNVKLAPGFLERT